MTPDAMPIGAIGRLSRAVFWACAAYWAVYVLVAPVTNVDSQMYNIARLELALRGGLFGNGHFTSVYQVIWPWAFDAVHLPFLQLGWGYAFPSFACLMGTCYVAFAMIRPRFGTDAAWTAVTALMGLTCLVYQGTSTKNDIPILFCGAVWAYALARWRQERNGYHVFWMVVAVGFMAGSKTTGVLYGAVLGLWTLWEVRLERAFAIRVLAGLAAAALLLGSAETYVESLRLFGHPLGPPRTVDGLRNTDGVRGAAANLSRYVAGSLYVGPSLGDATPDAVRRVAGAEESFLRWAGIADAGTDESLRNRTAYFVQSGFEEASGYGPVGTVAMATALAACLVWQPRKAWWRLAAAALLGFVVVSATIAFTYWANRYLVCWYALGTLAFVCALWESETAFRRAGRWLFLAVAASSAVAAPLLSFNRGPAGIAASLRNRDAFETGYFPIVGKVRERLRALRAADAQSRIFFIVRNTTAVLPILEDRKLDAILVTPSEFALLLSTGQVAKGDIVVNDSTMTYPGLSPVETVSAPDAEEAGLVRTQVIYRVAQVAPAP
jgi:hypothetical protein